MNGNCKMNNIFVLEKKKIKKSIGAKTLLYRYKNFEIEVEIDIDNPKHVVYWIKSTKSKEIELSKVFKQPMLITVNYFVDDKINVVQTLCQELMDAIEMMKHSDELDNIVMKEAQTF